MPETELPVENPGSLKSFLEQHEGSTFDDYQAALGKFREFVTSKGLNDSELLNQSNRERTTAA